jgi:hypothetical protein
MLWTTFKLALTRVKPIHVAVGVLNEKAGVGSREPTYAFKT